MTLLATATIELVVRGPILSKSSQIGPWGVDAVCNRDGLGRLYFPGAPICGKFREACDRLAFEPFDEEGRPQRRRYQALDRFRNVDESGDHDQAMLQQLAAEEDRYPLFCSDFVARGDWPDPGEQTITRVKISPATGAAEEGALRVLDCPVLPGLAVAFRGELRYFDASERSASDRLERILEVLRSIVNLGADGSVGSGRLLDVRLDEKRFRPLTITTAGAASSRHTAADASHVFSVDLRFHDPLCLPRGVINGNLFEAESIVPGETLKGALAQLLRQATGLLDPAQGLGDVSTGHPLELLCRHFNRMRFTPARPRPATARRVPQQVPWSLAFLDDRLVDFALSDLESLQHPEVSPEFFHDWKGDQWSQVEARFGTYWPPQELRARTAIESRNRRALTNNLFAQRVLRTENVIWQTSVTIDQRTHSGGSIPPNSVEANAMLRQLEQVLAWDALFVGKTKSRGGGRFTDSWQPQVEAVRYDGPKNAFVVALQSPALMVDPRELETSRDGRPSYATTEARLSALYEGYWEEASGGLLKPVPQRRYASHRLVGGFQAWRFRLHPDPDADLRSIDPLSKRIEVQKRLPYRPSLLTDAGSVFVLQTVDKKTRQAEQLAAQWLRHGLPVPQWALAAYGDTYHTNPFLNENGYAEVAVNSTCHKQFTLGGPGGSAS